MTIVCWILVVLVGYFLGNLNGALLISRMLMKDDVRNHGSGNAGLTNFFRTYGGFQTFFVIGIDIIKCVLACGWPMWFLPEEYGLFAGVVGGASCVFGHSFPVLEGFRGGKGFLCGLALAIATDWRVAVLALSIFIIVVLITRYVSMGSILAAAVFAASYGLFYTVIGPVYDWRIAVVGAATGLFAAVRHHKNLGRLLRGTESKLSFSKKK